jgi:signal transduction histidine kinase/ligand-binding sensor domain-containing protein
MWFGTQEGLTRYDGYDFKSYKHEPDKLTTISDSYVWCIIEDKSGILWIGTNDGGLNAFDPTTEQFTSYRHDVAKNTSLSHNYVRSICEDHEGIMWIGTYGGGLNRFDRKTGIFRKYQLAQSNPISLNNDNVTSIYEDWARNLWVGTHGGGIYRYNRSNDKFEKDLNGLNNTNVNCILEDRSGALWIGTQGGGLDKLDRTSGRFEHFTSENGLSHNNVLCLFEDQNGIIWIGTEGGGVNTFNGKTRHFTHYAHDVAIPNSLSNDVVRSIWEDNSGVIWIGTNSGGLNKYNPRSNQFALYQQNAAGKNSLSSNDIRAIYKNKSGILWIGTYGGGLDEFDQKNNGYKNYTTQNGDLTHNDVRCILEDRSGILWIGTRGGGLNIYDRKIGKFKFYKHKPGNENSLSNDSIRVIYEDRFGMLWIGTEGGGLNKFDKKTETFNHYTTGNKKLSNDIVFSIYEDRAGVLWVGTRVGGLNKYNRDHDSFTCYKHTENEDEKNSLSHNFVLSIYEDRSGVLWIGTYGGGLDKMIDREKGIFKSYRVKDGLSNDVIYGILEDNDGNLWLSTNNGISRFDPKKEREGKSFRNYDVEDGLQSNEFNSGAYFKSSNGEMFFGGVNGFNAFLPNDIKSNQFILPVVITELFIFNKPAKPQWQDPTSPLIKIIDEMHEVILSSQQNSVAFNFAALDYSSPQKNQYKYMLEGYDIVWINSDAKSRKATYTNLPAGEYVFRVKGSNSDGLWNEEGASLKIKILRPIWKTWWAYILYVIILAGITYLLWTAWSQRFLKRKIEEQTKELKSTQSQLVQSEKMRALGDLVANVAHELNNPASFIQITSYNLRQDMNKLKAFLLELAGDDTDKKIIDVFNEKFNALFKHLNTLNEGTSRINETVKNLRIFSHMDKSEMGPVNLYDGLKATFNLVKTKYKEDVDFITEFQPSLEVNGNSAELNQVFMNLLTNGCYAILEKQRLSGQKTEKKFTIRMLKEMGHAVIIFEDTGIGMNKEIKEKIFDPFFTTKPMGEGTGLGLSISYSIIKKHNGHIKVESEIEKGTVITLSFPLTQTKNNVENLEP